MVLSAMSVVESHHHESGYHEDALGNAYHALPLPAGEVEAATGGSGESLGAAAPLEDTFRLHSNPGASHTIFLDFDGYTTSGTSWNSFTGGTDIVTPAFSFSGDASFDDTELSRIHAIWQRVAEDFVPFDVDVTTEEPSIDRLIHSGSGDTAWGVRVVVGGNGSWYGNAGGVAYLGSFNWNSDTPVFAFEDALGNGNEKYTAEAITHEAGHALGLNHDGRTSPSEGYYQGHGSGATGWAPIMGVGYYKELTQWSRGEYAYANNTQDDLAIITGNNGFGYRADDHGDTRATASVLSSDQGAVIQAGIVERNDDDDLFTFLTDAGTVSFDVTPFERGPNLDIYAALLDATGALIVASNPVGSLSATLSATLAAGQYYVQVTGAGQGDALTTGYTDYGSLGAYTISGSIVQTNAGYVSISATGADQSEGDSGPKSFTFEVTRSGDTSSAADVAWSVSGSGSSATDAADFIGGVLPGGIVAFAAGETLKTVTVDVAGDTDFEADEMFMVTLSDATAGTLIATSTAEGTIRNDDSAPATPGITVTPTSGLTTSETGGTAVFSVVLDSAPTADVTISLSSSDSSEGIVDQTTLTFTPDNWDSPQIVTVTGVDDTVRDRNVSYVIQTGTAQSSDATYDGLDADDVQVTNQDNEKGKGGSGGGDDGGGGKGNGKGKRKTPAAAAKVEAVVHFDFLKSTDESHQQTDSSEQQLIPHLVGHLKPSVIHVAHFDESSLARTSDDSTESEANAKSNPTETSLSKNALDGLWSVIGRDLSSR
ncbi:Calx-beta domain protein [Stieleria maiorica]|uniref:Calx-beta domain protein n=1 Tax=Stieleria maiorica TaxID=2795974 RepID=A0A5B9MDG2_9BACT|nr:Calx-beta domain-containing protein [Stieleria maiorica]QEF98823.1 Calx-beta domain protein [Stieleria maiorica]